jgi:hypothetical protein
MRFECAVVAGLLVVSSACGKAQDASLAVADGGIKVAGWQGKIDPGEAARGGGPASRPPHASPTS